MFWSRRTLSIPVAEMITNSDTTMSLTYFPWRVKEACIKMGCRIVQPVRIEVDFSWPLINSFLLVFSSGNMVKHLHSCWKGHHRQPDWLYSCANMLWIIKHTLTTINFSKKLKEFGKFCFALLQNSASFGWINKDLCFYM